MKKDLGVLVKCNPLEPGSLSEIMGKSRVHTLVGVANRRRIMNTTGIKKGDSISSRNCAMTEVAKMMKWNYKFP